MSKLPDPKEVADSVADGVVELAEGPARIAAKVGEVATSFATDMRNNMEDFKKRMPDDPAAIPDCAIKAVGQTVKAGIGMAEGFGKGIMETFDGVKNQIRRVTG